jgi:hypothetical protein
MATLINYKGLQVVSPDPIGSGGLAIQNDLKLLADRAGGSGYVRGLELAYENASSVRIAPGSAISADGALHITVTSSSAVTITASGAGGLDTGAEAPRTIYYVYVIADSTAARPAAGLLSVRASAPVLPAGYDTSRRIGFVVNGANGDFLRFHQAWAGSTRRYHYAEDERQTRVLDNGSATAFTAVSCRAFVPSTARMVTLQALFTNNDGLSGAFLARLMALAFNGVSSDRRALLRTAGDTHGGFLYRIQSGSRSDDGLSAPIEIPCSASQAIEYVVSDGAARLTLAVVGVDDEL